MSPKEASKNELRFEKSYAEFIDSEMCDHLNTKANELFFKALRATFNAVCPAGLAAEKLFSKFIGSEECGEFNQAFNTVFYKATCEAHKSAYAAGYDDGRLAGYDERRLAGAAEAYDAGRLAGIAEAHDEGFAEESYGCLVGTHARDKDAIVASMALCEAAAYYKSKGMTLWDAMLEMYEIYGYYKDEVKSITLKGVEGLEKIGEIMGTLRKNPPTRIGEYKVTSARDYLMDTIRDMETGEVKPTGLPKSNVLYFDLEDDAWMCVRPSGTEPKIKFYYGVVGTSMEDAEEKAKKLDEDVTRMVDEIAG